MTAEIRVAALVPVFNHAETVGDVVVSVSHFVDCVIVVDDGSTDGSAEAVEKVSGQIADRAQLSVVRLGQNQGKGEAILAGMRDAASRGFTHVLVLDADGQHRASDAPAFLAEAALHPEAIIVGARDLSGARVPQSSRVGRAVSNFWTLRTTGFDLPDTQSGYRLYPIAAVLRLPLTCRRYDFEVEVLVRAAWAGSPLRSIPIDVYYPPREERVSHFRGFADNVRISWTYTRLVARRMLPTSKIGAADVKRLGLRDGFRWIRSASASGTRPIELGLAVTAGAFVGASPLWGLHTIIALYIGSRLNLNLIAVFVGSNVSFPLFAPYLILAAIQTGHFMLRGELIALKLSELSPARVPEHLLDYLVGAFPVAVVLSVALGLTTFAVSSAFRRAKP